MKTQGREQSTNIENRMTDPVDTQNRNNMMFLKQSYDEAATWKGSQSYNQFTAPKDVKTNGN